MDKSEKQSMELATGIYLATKLMNQMDGLKTVRSLKHVLVQDPEREMIDVKASKDRLNAMCTCNGIEHYREARMAIRNVLNFLYFSGMADPQYIHKPDSNKIASFGITMWWWENLYRFKKTLLIAAFLEGRNLESMGAENLSYFDIPQAIVGISKFIQSFEDDADLIAFLRKRHRNQCMGCDDIVKFYGVKEGWKAEGPGGGNSTTKKKARVVKKK